MGNSRGSYSRCRVLRAAAEVAEFLLANDSGVDRQGGRSICAHCSEGSVVGLLLPAEGFHVSDQFQHFRPRQSLAATTSRSA